ncbi:MAG TPA: hypothetical protein VGM13_05070 [Thermoanaerobaculia bacterium]|jgi:hypothetical protein
MRRILRVALCLAAVLLAAAPVAAEDFTITIPLQFSNLPPTVDGFLCGCWIYTGEPRLGGRSIGANNATRVNITGGAYRGDLVLRFNAAPGMDPATATHYECTGHFVGTERGATVHYFTTAFGPEVRFPLAAGAPFSLTTGVQALPR